MKVQTTTLDINQMKAIALKAEFEEFVKEMEKQELVTYVPLKPDIVLNELNVTEWSQFWDKELWKKRAGAFSIFDKPCPLKISQGNLEVVRGINSKWLKEQSKRI